MRAWILGVCVLSAAPAWAQAPIVNPTRAEFDSPDHATVSAYVLAFRAVGATADAQICTLSSVQMIAVGAHVTVDLTLGCSGALFAIPMGQTYEARIRAEDSATGLTSAYSGPSNPFVVRTVPIVPSNLALSRPPS